jgi:hypothetical protein
MAAREIGARAPGHMYGHRERRTKLVRGDALPPGGQSARGNAFASGRVPHDCDTRRARLLATPRKPIGSIP